MSVPDVGSCPGYQILTLQHFVANLRLSSQMKCGLFFPLITLSNYPKLQGHSFLHSISLVQLNKVKTHIKETVEPDSKISSVCNHFNSK